MSETEELVITIDDAALVVILDDSSPGFVAIVNENDFVVFLEGEL